MTNITPEIARERISRLERDRRHNRRQLDKLRARGGAHGATQAAIDRRLARDLDITRKLARYEELAGTAGHL